MANTVLQAGPQISIPINALQSDIARYSRRGDTLTIQLKNGDTITVNDFYKPAADGSLHSLTLRDNTNVDIQDKPEEELT
ncbi:BapA prefix-like domain-containing protein, partial [Rhodobacteraceae bacterium R_SAG2]|nr:BapA prefix-like domain-containing protein [Rhodobacteraceae bacterium R_SAG2]